MQLSIFSFKVPFPYMETMRTLPQLSLGESKYVHEILIPLIFMLTLKFCLLFLCLHSRKCLLLLNGSQRLVMLHYSHALIKFFNFSCRIMFSLNFIGLYHFSYPFFLVIFEHIYACSICIYLHLMAC